ncbi:MAG TPA: glycosyltransferase [Acidocella sp.]|nr:glycosyltransferase [Acidocella sp.]
MRIAQVMAGAANGGAELFYERMTGALSRAGQDVLPVIRREEGRASRLAVKGLAPVQFRFGGRLDFGTRPGIRRALQEFKPDIAMAWMSRAAAHLPRGPWVNVGRLGGYYDLKYFRACRYLVGNTRGIVDYITGTGFPPERTAYLPNFVTDFAGEAPSSRVELGIPEGAPLLLGLGRLHEVKGFDTLIQAMARLPDVYCVIAGEGPERPALEKLVAELKLGERVKLPGWRSDTGALLRSADVFVSSSRHEPLGNMVLEAFSAATPVLAARAEGPSEVIRDGEDGVLVPVDDANSLAIAARLLLGDSGLRAKLAAAGRTRFEAEFAEAAVTATWLDFFARVTC